ncbi:polyketide cyclase/dehydrase/lipid transport protein [Micromonospora sp. Llam0]|uniref:SRPBCC family protein n=1 Tax=Micromonospora sp. Llam0 TaxID=2485143 RepID=UPI000F47D9AF|nr:SRPBCC family protein [Micromonospora sp. Llam0]ROO52017.1 polyketide cyclase/dehydrase/lipid transport protein [Micromonospora sp. Llam0]
MFSLTDHIIIDAPADQVWEVVAGRFDRIGEWATAIPASAALPAAPAGTLPAVGAPVPGRVCHTGIALVPEATETIVEYDEAARSLTYQASGLPGFVTLARNRWQITALGPHRCRAEFQAQLQVRGALGKLARWWLLARVGRTGQHLLADLRHLVEHGTVSPRKQRQLNRLTLQRSRIIRAPLPDVWEIISDLDGYHRHTDTLAVTTVISGAGQGARRRCVDSSARDWQETCTLWQPHDRYVMDVDVSTYPAAYRAMFRTFTGAWSVAPVDGGTQVTIRFDARLRRVPGLAALARLHAERGGADMEAILDSYQRTAEQQAG